MNHHVKNRMKKGHVKVFPLQIFVSEWIHKFLPICKGECRGKILPRKVMVRDSNVQRQIASSRAAALAIVGGLPT